MGNDNKNAQLRTTAPIDAALLKSYAENYGHALKRYFGRRGAPPQSIEDLVQDVYARLAARAGGQDLDNPEAYLMQTASSVWIDFLRKRERRGEHTHFEYDDSAHSPEGFTPERVLEGRQAVERLAAVLRELPDRTRHIYLLCRLDGMKRDDVARRLGITVSAVDKHLMTATKRVKKLLGELE